MKKTLKDIALFIGAILMIGAVVASGIMKFLANWDHMAGIKENLTIAMWTVPIFLFGLFLAWLGGGEIDG